MGKKLTTAEFINRAIKKHGNRYDYSKVVYQTSTIPIIITCKEHGDFVQTPSNHLYGVTKCPKCAITTKRTRLKDTEQFILESQATHSDKYDYSAVTYTNDSQKVTIICPKHGRFKQTPNKHLQGQGCPMCAHNAILLKVDFVNTANKVHHNKYNYDLIPERVPKFVEIVCLEHGPFTQYHVDHLQGHGCRKCFDSNRLTFNEFKSRHGREGFSYSGFIGYFDTFSVTCHRHNTTFLTTPHIHATREHGGCKKCKLVSSPHQKIIDFLEGEEFEVNDRSVIPPLELDIYLPKYKLGIEVNGLYWHSKRNPSYHENKFQECLAKGVTLLQLWDFEIYEHWELIKSLIHSKMGKSKLKIGARKCTIQTITAKMYYNFLDEHHLEGPVFSGERKGLFYTGNLVAVMGFSGDTMQRFCVKSGYSIAGGFSKLLSSFNNEKIITYSDNRYSVGDIYRKLGFTKVSCTPRRLFITDYKKLYGRRSFQRKSVNRFPNYSDDKTVEEIINEQGYFYLYSAGTQTWELKNNGCKT